MSDQKFRLRWNSFEEDVRGVYKEIRELSDFSDVTLLCEDGEVEGHRVLLAAASPLLRALLREHQHRPSLRLAGLHLSTLRNILDFIYLGEVSLGQEELATFLTTARGLQLRGLGGELAEVVQAEVAESGRAVTVLKVIEEQEGKAVEKNDAKAVEVGKVMVKRMGKILEKLGVKENNMHVGNVGEKQGGKGGNATGKQKWRVDGKVRAMEVAEQVKVGLVEEQKAARKFKDKSLKALGKAYAKVVEENNNLVECGEVGSSHKRVMSGMELNVLLDGMVEVVVGEGVRCTTCRHLFTNKTRALLHCELHLQLAQPCLMCSKAFGSRATLSRHYFEGHSLKYISPFAL